MEWTAELFNVLHPGNAEEQEPANFKEPCRDNRWVKSKSFLLEIVIEASNWITERI
jgi:hypothetical protein